MYTKNSIKALIIIFVLDDIMRRPWVRSVNLSRPRRSYTEVGIGFVDRFRTFIRFRCILV